MLSRGSTGKTLRAAAQGSSDEAIQALMAPTPEDPQPLTEQEVEEREELLKSGFSNWNRRDFSAFTRACEKVRGAAVC